MSTIEERPLDPIASFLEIDDAAPAVPVADRSTLERYVSCPSQARFVETGRVNNSSALANAGQEVHHALGETLNDYVREQGLLTKFNLHQRAEEHLLAARPDVQPEALRAFKRALWPWAELISSIAYPNLLHYDGGVGRRSGQLAADVGGIRVTSEIDLLYASPSKAILEEVDYKSGHKLYSHQEVWDSFQFGLHALLVFANYPEVQALRVRVWNSRSNGLTWPVEFRREQASVYDVPQERGPDRRVVGPIYARVNEAVAAWLKWRNHEPEKAAAWPELTKCSICPAAIFCPVAGDEVWQLNDDPGAFVDQMVAVEAKLKAMKKLAGKYVDKNGDIVSESGACYGGEKPKSKKKPVKSLYKLKGDDEGEQESEAASE